MPVVRPGVLGQEVVERRYSNLPALRSRKLTYQAHALLDPNLGDAILPSGVLDDGKSVA